MGSNIAIESLVAAFKEFAKEHRSAIFKYLSILQKEEEKFASLTSDSFRSYSESDLAIFIDQAMNSEKHQLGKKIIDANGFSIVRDSLGLVLFGDEPMLPYFYKNASELKWVTPYLLATLLSRRYPNGYAPMKSQGISLLKEFGILDPSFTTEKMPFPVYFVYTETMKEVLETFANEGLPFANLLSLEAVIMSKLKKPEGKENVPEGKKESKEKGAKPASIKTEQIGKTLREAILTGSWVQIEYANKEGKVTKAWYAIKDIDPITKTLTCDTFNSAYDLETHENYSIVFDRIRSAALLPISFYKTPEALIKKLEEHPEHYLFLGEKANMSAIFSYLSACARLDNDPYQSHYRMIKAIDHDLLLKNGEVLMDDMQFAEVVRLIEKIGWDYKKHPHEYSLALSLLSIDEGDKKYLVAYHLIRFDPSKKSLILDRETRFNPTFLTDTETRRRHSLVDYYDGDAATFQQEFMRDRNSLIAELKERIDDSKFYRGQIVDTRPDIMVLERENPPRVAEACALMEKRHQEGRDTAPVKAFLGEVRKPSSNRAEPRIIAYDDKVDINQLVVCYNVLKFPLVYVQGPPGTGKTNTIFNLCLSLFAAKKKVLITSNNNKPVNDLCKKLDDIGTVGGEKISIPYIRLGNNETMAKAALSLREYFERDYGQNVSQAAMDRKQAELFSRADALSPLLKDYLRKKEAEKALLSAERFLELSRDRSRLQKGMAEVIEKAESEYHSLPCPTEEEIFANVHFLKDNEEYLSFFNLLMKQHLRILLSKSYEPLREIAYIVDEDERARAFNSYCAVDDNMALLSDAFPFIFCTNASSSKLGTGNFLFDLLIMDEAGQCDIACSLIPLSRAENLLLTGDHKQLPPIISIDPGVHENLKKKYAIPDTFDYMSSSLLSHQDKVDKLSKRVMLSYHYRCGKKIISFSNRLFYNDELDLTALKRMGDVRLFSVESGPSTGKHTSIEEAHHIIKFLKDNGYRGEKGKEVKIIVPFVDQMNLINTLLKKEGLGEVEAATIHSLQGAEAKTIIFSPAVSSKTASRTYQWLKSNQSLINVAVSRAIDNFYVFADPEAIERLSIANKGDDNEIDAIACLINYCKEQGNVSILPKASAYGSFCKSNLSQAEDDFFKTVCQVLSFDARYVLKRDISVADVFPKDEGAISHKEMYYDSVIFIKGITGRLTPVICFEVAGGEHTFDKKRRVNDKIKEGIATRNNCRWLMVENSSVKDYEMIKSCIEAIFSGFGKKAKAMEQLSLFEEE